MNCLPQTRKAAQLAFDCLKHLDLHDELWRRILFVRRVTTVPFFDLKRQFSLFRGEVLSEIASICDAQAFVLGPRVEEFERAIEILCGGGHAVGASSGTDAELLILMALGIGPGDAVITTPFTFFSTAGCIARLGAKPVFVDIEPETFNLSPEKLALCLNEECGMDEVGVRTRDGLRVKAVIPVHLFGLCCRMDEIRAVCARYNLPVIEDAAQAIGAEYPSSNGIRRAGGMGEFSYFSFYPTKNLGAFGDAGLAIAQDEKLAKRMKILRNHGMDPLYYHDLLGGNFRLDALQAAILLKKLPLLAGWSKRRNQIAQYYRREFADFAPELRLPAEPYRDQLGERGHIYHQYVVRTAKRDRLREHLNNSGIGTAIYYPVSLNHQKCFAELRARPFPESELAAREVLALPIFPELEDDEVQLVVDTVSAFFKN
jgi:dTDP-4-amino-4,6-dideoxygalactose transaminase